MKHTEYKPGEPYEFLEDRWSYKDQLVYRCFRGVEGRGGNCNGRTVLVEDRKTHNNYHNHVDVGLPNPYFVEREWEFEEDFHEIRYREYYRPVINEPRFVVSFNAS